MPSACMCPQSHFVAPPAVAARQHSAARPCLQRLSVQAETDTAPDVASMQRQLLPNLQNAERVSYGAAAVMITIPQVFVAPLLPPLDGLPSFAVASAAAALRVAGAFTLLQGAALRCIGDAAQKGILVKSATYRRLSFATLGVAVHTIVMLAAAYAFGKYMGSPFLAFLVLAPAGFTAGAALGACSLAAWQGRVEQLSMGSAAGVDAGAEQLIDEATETVFADARELWSDARGVTQLALDATFFYRTQLALALGAGVLLIVLPATIVESPEPSYTAETLMRRVSGLNAATMMVTINWILCGASRRDRLGASTFRTLNLAVGGVTVLVAASMALLLHECGADELAPAAAVVAAPGIVNLYQATAQGE